MADFSFSDDAEIQKLNQQVIDDPEEFENWEKLVRAAESQEGGLNRNSSPGAIASTRDVYDKFLARFPLFFGYWKKYADLEFSIAGTEAAEMVYERGVASIGISVDLWANYGSFKVETSHDADVIRELFERGADSVGLDFLAHPFWDKYLEFEERVDAHDRIFAILGRIIHIPMHQYARYFEKYRSLAASRPVTDLAPTEIIEQFREQILSDGAAKPKSDKEAEQQLRAKIDAFHLEIFQLTQTETTKRWTYESEVKRPYYHVTELDEAQLTNWSKYLDFEESEGDYTRTKFLYERCLVTAANYEDMWLRYARWMSAQENKNEEVRNIYGRASCVYVPIAQPAVRLSYAQFEESIDRPDVAIAIHESILMTMPNHIEAILSLANVHRRQYGLEKAIEVIKRYIDSAESTTFTRGALVSEWARLIWRGTGDATAAREIYQKNEQLYFDSSIFWTNWLEFELQQPTSEKEEGARHERIKKVFDDIRQYSRLQPELIKQLSVAYFGYLKERGGKEAMKEYMKLDQEINGPISTSTATKAMLEGGSAVENGGPNVKLDAPPVTQHSGSKRKGKHGGHAANGRH